MGIFDRAREALHEHPDQVDGASDRLADDVDRRTGGTRATDLDRGADLARDRLGERSSHNAASAPGPDGR